LHTVVVVDRRNVPSNEVFDARPRVISILRTSAISIIGFVVVSVVFMPFADPDDRPPGVVMRVLLTLGAVIVATAAATFERIFQNAVDIKSENDLTV
jgi:hypothetical protein